MKIFFYDLINIFLQICIFSDEQQIIAMGDKEYGQYLASAHA